MNKIFTVRNVLISGGIIIILFGAGLYTNIIKLPITRTISFMYPTDFSDDRKLMGAYHNVFVGKVIKQIGNESRSGDPKTQFEVEVIYNIKGKLEGTVIVDQNGGYKNGILYLVHEGDVVLPAENAKINLDSLLIPEGIYLLAARYSERDNWYTVSSSFFGKKLITNDIILDREQLELLIKNNERVKQLQEAYPKEILLESDVRSNNTRNSYQQLVQQCRQIEHLPLESFQYQRLKQQCQQQIQQ